MFRRSAARGWWRAALTRATSLLLMTGMLVTGPAWADDDGAPPALAIESRPVLRRPSATAAPSEGGSNGWWLGPLGAVAVVGGLIGLGWAARRWNWKLIPHAESAGLEVIGRVGLSPKHAIIAVRAGDRVLLVGTGAGGPPSLLTEWPSDVLVAPGPRPSGGAGR